MKKFIPVFITFVLVISLCACSGSGKSVKFTPKLNQPFVVTAKIHYGDEESDATMRKYGTANWDVEFSAPNTLAGVILSYRDDKVDASYKGLSFSVPKSALPVKSIISALIEAVDSMGEQTEIDVIEKDELMITEGELQQGKYTLKLNKDGGIAEFLMSNLDLKIEFTDFHADSADMSEPTMPSSEVETQSTDTQPTSETQTTPSDTTSILTTVAEQ